MKVIQKPDEALSKLLPLQKASAGTEYVPSQFTVPFSHGGSRYVFHTLTKELLEGELPASCHGGEGFDDLIKGYFLVQRGKDECSFYESTLALMRALHGSEGTVLYTILPTTACNARCVYCFEADFTPVTMTRETADQTVRYILETRDKSRPVRLFWFGGEPLLGVRSIDRICLALRDEGIEYTSSMITNATLVTPEIVEKMTGSWNLHSIQISVDGAEEDYRCRKNFPVYRDEYHKVMDAVNMLSEAGIPVSVRCNVDEENWPRIPRFLEEMREGIVNKENVRLYLTPLYAVRESENDMDIWEKVITAEQQIGEAGFRTSYDSRDVSSFRLHFCMADRVSPVIGPDGSLYHCEHCLEEHRFGDVWHGADPEDAENAFCNAVHAVGKCRKCALLPICTPFSRCPVRDRHCADFRGMILLRSLCRMLEKGTRGDEAAPAEVTDC